jgi:hypothetical protein
VAVRGVKNAVKHDADAVAELQTAALYALEKELSVRANLRETRKTISAILALIIGIGFFRVDIHRRPDEVTVVPFAALCFIRGFFTLALILMVPGVWYLFTERGVKHETERAANTGSALSELTVPDDLLARLAGMDKAQAMWIRTKALRLAYERLVEANARVRRRVYVGLYWLLGSLLLALIGFTVYLWTIRAASDVPQPREVNASHAIDTRPSSSGHENDIQTAGGG